MKFRARRGEVLVKPHTPEQLPHNRRGGILIDCDPPDWAYQRGTVVATSERASETRGVWVPPRVVEVREPLIVI